MTNLKQGISNAIATIDETMLQRTRQEIEYRRDVICATNGAPFRSVLNKVMIFAIKCLEVYLMCQ